MDFTPSPQKSSFGQGKATSNRCRRHGPHESARAVLRRARGHAVGPENSRECDASRRSFEIVTDAPQDLVVRDPKICQSRATIRGTRVMMSVIRDNLAADLSEDEILAGSPSVTREGIRFAIADGAELARDEYPAVAGERQRNRCRMRERCSGSLRTSRSGLGATRGGHASRRSEEHSLPDRGQDRRVFFGGRVTAPEQLQ